MSEQLPEPTLCRDCRAPIRWGKTPRGVQMPVEAEPSSVGTVFLYVNRDVLYADSLVGAQLAAVRRSPRPLYERHIPNCPRANSRRTR